MSGADCSSEFFSTKIDGTGQTMRIPVPLAPPAYDVAMAGHTTPPDSQSSGSGGSPTRLTQPRDQTFDPSAPLLGVAEATSKVACCVIL